MKFTPSLVAPLDRPPYEAVRQNHERRLVELQTASNAQERARGRLLLRQVLTGAGTYAPTLGTRAVRVRLVGGGGGGGGAGGGANGAAGGGGASGTHLDFWLFADDAIIGGAFAAGAGGAGGTNTGGTGGNGVATTIVLNGRTYAASGGGGATGLASVAIGFGFPGGLIAGSTSTNVDLVYGEQGQPGIVVSPALFWGGSGGSTPLGAGGGTGVGSQAGNPGQGFGGGGGGACTGVTNRAGGAGAAGGIIVEEYS